MEALKMEDRVDSWNDDRLDELSGRMDEGFKEMREGFARVANKEEVGEVRVELRRVNDRLDKLMLMIFATCVSLFGTVFVGTLGLVLQA
jgi:hypothetical protein